MIVMVPGIISLSAFFISIIAFIVLVIRAFKSGLLRGVFCLVVPFYVFYHAVQEYTEQGRRWISMIFIGGFLVGILFQGLGWLIL